MEWLIYNLIWILECTVILLCLHTVNGEKMHYNRKTMVMIIINNLMYNLFYVEMLPKPCADIVIIASLIVYSVHFFKKRVWEMLLRFLGGILLVAVIEIEAIFLVSFVEKMLVFLETPVVVTNIIVLIFASFINNYFTKNDKNGYNLMKDKAVVGASLLCMIVCCIMMVDFFVFHIMNRFVNFIVIILVVVLYIYLSLLKKNRKKLEAEQQEVQLHQRYYEVYKELVAEVRRKQHDYKNQLTTLYGMNYVAEDNKKIIETQKQYVVELERKFKYEHLLTGCNNSILSGFLYQKCGEFEVAGIDVKFVINVDCANCVMYLHELVEIIGILLDNAFEYLMTQNKFEPCINLKILEDKENMFVEVKNQSEYLSSQEIEKIFQEGYSTKGKNRGIGLYRVKQLIDKYNAELIVENEEDGRYNWLNFRIIIKNRKLNG